MAAKAPGDLSAEGLSCQKALLMTAFHAVFPQFFFFFFAAANLSWHSIAQYWLGPLSNNPIVASIQNPPK